MNARSLRLRAPVLRKCNIRHYGDRQPDGKSLCDNGYVGHANEYELEFHALCLLTAAPPCIYISNKVCGALSIATVLRSAA
jgi:hypothetical protein